MDPLTALGLATNVVQFIQFPSNLIQTTVDIRRSSARCTVNSDVGLFYGQLNHFNAELALSPYASDSIAELDSSSIQNPPQ